MSIHSVFAAVAVSDLAEAKDFYARLLGRPVDFEPMPSLAQWNFGPANPVPAGALQIVEAPEVAGKSMVTLMVADLDATLAELAMRGIAYDEVVSGSLSRLTELRDPAGNVITVAEIPASS